MSTSKLDKMTLNFVLKICVNFLFSVLLNLLHFSEHFLLKNNHTSELIMILLRWDLLLHVECHKGQLIGLDNLLNLINKRVSVSLSCA